MAKLEKEKSEKLNNVRKDDSSNNIIKKENSLNDKTVNEKTKVEKNLTDIVENDIDNIPLPIIAEEVLSETIRYDELEIEEVGNIDVANGNKINTTKTDYLVSTKDNNKLSMNSATELKFSESNKIEKTTIESKVQSTLEDKKNADKKYSSVLVMGDSLTVDIGEKFQGLYPGAVIDGKIGRQLYVAVEEAKSYSKYNNENSAIIFQLGTNGPFTESQIEELVKEFDKADIYFVNIKVPRAWEKTVNAALKETQEKHSNVKIIDWYSVANSSKDLFEPDRVHLNQTGIAEMVTLIEKNLKRPVEIKTN